jgi:glycosyltransferase involved in cell wall biosynthesis
VVVVLDRCTDDSEQIAREHLGRDDRILEVGCANVGAARAAGVEHALTQSDLDPVTTWLAHTDADSEVPRHWLARHLGASRGVDALAGVVRVADWTSHPAGARRAFVSAYGSMPVGRHPHIHGANLGVRASAYLAVGGFPPVACSEDHALWEALRDAGHRLRTTRRIWVSTSGRPIGRATGGFADTLVALDHVISQPIQPSPFPRLAFAEGDPCHGLGQS